MLKIILLVLFVIVLLFSLLVVYACRLAGYISEDEIDETERDICCFDDIHMTKKQRKEYLKNKTTNIYW